MRREPLVLDLRLQIPEWQTSGNIRYAAAEELKKRGRDEDGKLAAQWHREF
jgi:hypothetical protein